MVAAMGRKVVAIDAMDDNLRYLNTSLELGKLSKWVQLRHVAIR